MTLHSWRMVKQKHTNDAFNGEGARRFGGRWHSRGIPVVYTAANASLTVLEMLVHVESSALLQDYVLYRVEFEERLVETLDEGTLPDDWRSYPAPVMLRGIGDQWVADGRSAVLSVPSAIVPLERVFLLNPQHTDFPRIEVSKPQAFPIDPRLLKD